MTTATTLHGPELQTIKISTSHPIFPVGTIIIAQV